MFSTVLVNLRVAYHMQCYNAMLVHIDSRTSMDKGKKEKKKKKKKKKTDLNIIRN